TQLTGLIDGDPDGDMAWLTQTERSVRFGGRRSTSGLATLSAGPEASPTSFTGFMADQRRLVVRLLAPGIFVDTLGRPSWLPDITELSATLGVPVALDAAFARPTVVSGWHAVSNLPKPRDFAVAAGSVFVLRFDAGLPDHAGLRRLWCAGLGLRRAEGNGWITLQRWNAPALPSAAPTPSPDGVHELFLQIVGYGIGPTIVDDLRGWAQQRHVRAAPSSTAADILAKQRYSLLSPEARDAVRAAFALPAADAERLARRIDDWTRARTSTRGRTA
ncbi:MAG: type III-B CRISPR module-associated Cmr3 family protein, partial [Pseudonocardiaceae bacterium]